MWRISGSEIGGGMTGNGRENGVAREPILRVHHILSASCANGPGLRFVVWVQGCSLGCRGCFNPATHAPAGGRSIAVFDLFAMIAAEQDRFEGITLTGGEPLDQRAPVLALLRRVREETRHSIILFTGYTWEEFQAMPEAGELAACLDLLIAGPYDASRPSIRGLCGSENQSVHFLTDRYSAEDIAEVPEAEVIVTPDGSVLRSGIRPVAWPDADAPHEGL